MLSQQTIVSSIEPNRIFEQTDKDGNSEFMQTDHDIKISEFLESLAASKPKFLPLNISNFAVNDYLITYIQYIEESKINGLIQTPQNIPGLKIV